MMIEPRHPMVYWNILGKQLKIWRQYKITDAHAHKLLRLFLGFEFTDLMDEFGRYPAPYFNEIRRRLGYASMDTLMNDLRACCSFFIVGVSEDKVTAIFSPVWHMYEPADGTMLQGSCQLLESQTCGQTFDVYIQDNNIHNATASNDGAFSPGGEVGENGNDNPNPNVNPNGVCVEIERDVHVRRRIVSDYFKWLVRQPMSEHKSLVENLRYRISHPHDKKGHVMVQFCLDEEQTNEVWDVMVEKVLVPYFQTRDEFFKPLYMQHPEKRIWWLTALFKKWGNKLVVDATKKWKHNRRSIEAQSANAQIEAQMLYRPRSQHEWEDPNGQRWYITPKGTKQQIPADAPPRPSDNSNFNYISNKWLETKV